MDYKVTDTELTDVADAIREKTGDDSPLEFPAGFVDAISSIENGTVASGVTYEYKTVTVNSPSPILPIGLQGGAANLSKLFIGAVQGQQHNDNIEEDGYDYGFVVAESIDVAAGESFVAAHFDRAVELRSSETPVIDSTAQTVENDATYYVGVYWVLAIYEDEE